MTTPALRVVSHGGGRQTTAMLVLAAQGRIDFRTFLFANVGNDSEEPACVTYLHEVAMPYALRHGIQVHELFRVKRDGSTETLYGRMVKPGSRSLPIPVRMANGAPGTRTCTTDFKIAVIRRWLKAHGATTASPATVAIGFSLDEWQRATTRRPDSLQDPCYPLLELRLTVSDCLRIIDEAGLPIPPKSACWFCPFQRPSSWIARRRTAPEQFEQAAQLEDMLNDRRDMLGKDHVYLTRLGLPLRLAITTDQPMLPGFEGPEGCGGGSCWT